MTPKLYCRSIAYPFIHYTVYLLYEVSYNMNMAAVADRINETSDFNMFRMIKTNYQLEVILQSKREDLGS